MFNTVKNYQLLFFGMVLTIFIPFFASDKKNTLTAYDILKEGAIGGIAGGVEPLFTQPIINAKIHSQQGRKFFEITKMVKNNPSTLYTGMGANVVCSVPSIAAQIGFDFAIKDTIPSNDIVPMALRNTIIGGFSALTCNSTELIIINQQNNKLPALKTIKNLHHENGITVFGRGFLSKTARESLFCMGFLTGYPHTKVTIEKKLNNLNRTGSPSGINSFSATVLASCLVGGPTALISHPFDTASTLLQADPSKKDINGYMDIANMIHKQGIGVMYRGCGSRAFLVMLAMPILTGAKDSMKNMV